MRSPVPFLAITKASLYRRGGLALLCLLPSLAWAQVVWDNGGGNNLWGTGSNWSTNNVPTGASNVQFNATDDNATVSNISLTANRSANSLTFNSVNDSFSLINGSGSRTLTLTSGDITRTAGSSGTQTLAFTTLALGGDAAMNINGTGRLVISSNIVNSGGARSLTKSGTGELVLSGTNTYSGGTTLSAGTLTLGNNSALGSGGLTINGGTIAATGGSRTLANNVTVGGDFAIGGSSALTFNGTINLGGGTRTITVNNTAATTFAGSVTEPWYSGLNKAGSGELILSGSNTFSAPVTVSDGTLTLAHSNALGATGTWNNTVASGATLAFSNNIAINEGSVSVSGTGDGGNGALRNLSGDNSFAGTVNLTGNTTVTATAGSLTASGPVNLGSNTLTVSGAGGTTLSGVIGGNGGITKTDAGALTLSGSGANSFVGTLAINSGTVALAKTDGTHAIGGATVNIGDGAGATASAVLRLDGSNQIADYASLITINADGVLQVNNFTEGINTIAGTGLIDLSTSGYLAVGVNSGSSSFGGSLAGTGTFEKAGTGTLTFTNDIDFDGTLQLSGGTLSLSSISLSADTLHVTGNSIIDFGGTASILDLANLTIADGVTLTIQNWANATDFFFTQNWAGASFDTTGANPVNQVVFTGFSANDTKWQSYDNQITPVPEPSTYGGLMIGGLAAFAAWRRRRAAK
jgi:fibronectin-binding autotransporter adhesin